MSAGGSADDPGRYPAALYAALHTGTPGDLGFYRRTCQGAARILELGCGAGRVLAALRGPERTLVGVDHHRGLLARARAAVDDAVQLVEADLRTVDLGERFDRIVLAHSTLYAVGDDLDAVAQVVARHLAPHGAVVFDAWAADAFHHGVAQPGEGAWVSMGSIVADGRAYRVLESSTWDPDTRRIEVRYRHLPDDGTAVVTASLVHRYLLREEIEAGFVAVGLPTVALWGDFEGAGLDASSEILAGAAARESAAVPDPRP